MDGKKLRALFNRFNEQYFSGRLPVYSIRVVPKTTWLGESGRCIETKRVIEIQSGQSDEDAISTLLHEMAHAAHPATKGYHTTSWKKEMIRLRESGAPLTSFDLNVSLDDWDGKKVRREHFRSVIQDALCDGPDMTVSAAIRWFISSVGGPRTIKEFRKKYPWVKAVFDFEKRGRAEDQERTAKILASLRSKRA